MLRAIVLALDHDARGLVGDAHRGLGPVHVLASGAARAVDVDAQIRGIHLDVDVVVHLGGDEHRGEAGVAAVARIEGGLAHQAVHAGLGAQPAVCVVAVDAHGRALDARLLARRALHQLGIEAAPLGPAQVHSKQHLGPVLRLGAAGAGLDVEEGRRGVHLAGEHAPELELGEPRLERVEVTRHLAGGVRVLLRRRQLEQLARIARPRVQRLHRADDLLELRALAAHRLRALGIVPQLRALELAVHLLQPFPLRRVVKGTP